MAGTATHYIAMIEGCKNFPSPDMIERIAEAFGKDTLGLFSLIPIQHDWKALILSDIGTLVDQRLKTPVFYRTLEGFRKNPSARFLILRHHARQLGKIPKIE